MDLSTEIRGYVPKRGSTVWRELVELFSSMRFAIALLTVICIASVIGTVVEQHLPAVNYVDQFGPFWAALFLKLDLNAVYSAWWFMLILLILVVSVSVCVGRKSPKYLADIRNFKEDIRERNLQAFHHKASGHFSDQSALVAAERIGNMLRSRGWKFRVQERETKTGPGYMVAAKAGSWNKIGYIAAHSAIVLICLGGLLDGDLFVRGLSWMGGKTVYNGGGFIADVSDEHRLPASNPTFRGNLVVSEGTQSSTAILSQSDGVLLQSLPFAVELKKFDIQYYSNGQPRLFSSDIVIHDFASGEKTPARVEVNHPVSYGGVQIYQSSFDDGGSQVKLEALPLDGSKNRFFIEGKIGESSQVTNGNDKMTLEFTDLKTINVENLATARVNQGPTDVRRVDLRQTFNQKLGAADKISTDRDMRNVGPSISYSLRDASGQARDYHNYMRPIDMGDGTPVFLLGVRDSPAEGFRYLRIPADANDSMDGFLRLRAALASPSMREQAVERYVAEMTAGRAEMTDQLKFSVARALDLFAGAQAVDGRTSSGLQALSDFIESAVPEGERERAAEVLLRLFNGALYNLDAVAREAAGGEPLSSDDAATGRYLTQSVMALSDLPHYPAPMVFQLDEFTPVQASVFEVTRAPGKFVVYLGCLLLILGVFAMLYIRDRRLWVWLAPQDGGVDAKMALSYNKKMLDADREFDELRHLLFSVPVIQEDPSP